jgi:hypothetical protein
MSAVNSAADMIRSRGTKVPSCNAIRTSQATAPSLRIDCLRAPVLVYESLLHEAQKPAAPCFDY